MKRSILFIAAMLIVTAGALAFRLPKLSMRVMHTDEAVHTIKFQELLEEGRYVYDPHEYHGPTIYYAALPVYWLSSARSFAQTTETTFRIVPVVFGTALVLLCLLLGRGLGPPAAVCAAILTAISHAMVYYSRYYVQEMLFVFFTSATLVFAWRYARSPRAGWAIAAGLCAGLMHATKETCIIAFAAMGVALVCVLLWRRRTTDPAPAERRIRAVHVLVGIGVAVAASVVCYSTFFTNARGPLDSVLTYAKYFQRAGTGSIHEHPWYYYLHMLASAQYGRIWWSEAFVLFLAVVGLAMALSGRGAGSANVWLLRFLAFYTLVATVIYSAVPYKTPWSILGTYHGMILLAGVGAAGLVRLTPTVPLRALLVLLLAGVGSEGLRLMPAHWRRSLPVPLRGVCGGGFGLARQAHLGNYKYYDNSLNPYVYSHTSRDFLRLPARLEALADVCDDGHNMIIEVVAPEADFWPLPWYVRGFNRERIGYYDGGPERFHNPVVVIVTDNRSEDADAGIADAVAERLGDGYLREHYGLRPGGVLMAAFIRRDVWDKFIQTRTNVSGKGR